jgi:hypothetical protein
VADIWQTLWQLLVILGTLLGELIRFAAVWLLLIVWIVWWLCGVNWRKAWTALAEGAWAPVVLLMLLVALVWSQVAPSSWGGLGFITIGNFWWQLGAVTLLVGLALFCGWLQGVFHWEPPELNLEPPAPVAHGHDAAHGHGHH